MVYKSLSNKCEKSFQNNMFIGDLVDLLILYILYIDSLITWV
ncbi:MAG: hypothetical protein ACJAZK_000641 [Psychroserpens sp.]|jgi:hypothetical protein